MIHSAHYTADGSIAAVIDGAAWTVPDDPDNRHRAMLAAWEAEGNTIASYEAPPPPLPMVVSMRQARLAMHHAGLLDAVETALATAERAAQIEWEYATEVRRDHPLIASIAGGLALSDEQVDALFVAAAAIE